MNDSDEFIITRRILHLSNLLLNSRNDELKKYNLTFVQAETLIFFDKVKGAKAQELGKHFSITHQAARNIVERLCRKQYLYTEINIQDARARSVYLTDAGQEVCNYLKMMGLDDGHRLLDGMEEDERKDILKMLKKMIENIKDK